MLVYDSFINRSSATAGVYSHWGQSNQLQKGTLNESFNQFRIMMSVDVVFYAAPHTILYKP